MAKQDTFQAGWHVSDISWKAVWLGYFLGLIITLAVGAPVVLVSKSTWLLGLAGLGALFGVGILVGAKAGSRTAVINGALVGVLYNLTVVLALFVGWFFELLPEPLPGLPQGNSTFFFAWPLMQFAASVVSAIVGSRLTRKPRGGKV